MNILVACEYSGVVRNAFRKKGHNAVSCDLLPNTDIGGSKWHLQGDVFSFINSPWDMMIAFPPCTHLAVSGSRHFEAKRKDGRQQAALDFVRALMGVNIPKIAIENPVGIISTEIRKPDQIIQPWQFGEPESKKTCLWLKNLTLLVPTNILQLPASGRWANQTPSGQNNVPGGKNQWKIRSQTYQGIADAMAEQWG